MRKNCDQQQILSGNRFESSSALSPSQGSQASWAFLILGSLLLSSCQDCYLKKERVKIVNVQTSFDFMCDRWYATAINEKEERIYGYSRHIIEPGMNMCGVGEPHSQYLFDDCENFPGRYKF